MNVITYRAAYSFFPVLTFERRYVIPCICMEDVEELLGKYYDRGWKEPASEELELDTVFQSVAGLGRRWSNDKSSWVIRFDISEIEDRLHSVSRTVLSLNVDPFSANSFNVDVLYDPSGTMHPPLTITEGMELRTQYAVVNDASSE